MILFYRPAFLSPLYSATFNRDRPRFLVQSPLNTQIFFLFISNKLTSECYITIAPVSPIWYFFIVLFKYLNNPDSVTAQVPETLVVVIWPRCDVSVHCPKERVGTVYKNTHERTV